MEYLFVLGGVIIGNLIAVIFMRRKTGYGNFTITPLPDEDVDGLYTVNVHISDSQNLLDKDKIILYKKSTQK